MELGKHKNGSVVFSRKNNKTIFMTKRLFYTSWNKIYDNNRSFVHICLQIFDTHNSGKWGERLLNSRTFASWGFLYLHRYFEIRTGKQIPYLLLGNS